MENVPEILCERLSVPLHGNIITCGNRVEDSCDMACNDGHIRVSGDATRVCHGDGAWTGQDLVCQG